MGFEELILEEPEKISKKELDEVYEAYKVIEHFCQRIHELAIYHLDDAVNRHARELRSRLKLHLKLLLRTILNENYCHKDALEVLKKKEVDSDADNSDR